ncbi:MAG: flagellar filament capping protein FliD [Zoogloeaceae bacterium]|jgi:flagellar hook-associated protein 2|nr:flagellar filament capping protein FliD [Zoogloeaceae bacterium]
MATFSAIGIGAGTDLSTLLEGLMSVERRPLTAIKSQMTSHNSKISALGTLQSKLSGLQTAAQALKPATLQSALEKFAAYSGSLANDKVGKVSVEAGATAGSYKLEVVSLASGQKDISNAFAVNADGKALLAGGTFEISFGAGDARNVSINTSAGETLEDLRNTINSNTAKSGVSASIINGAYGQRLVLNGAEGTGNSFTASGGGIVFGGQVASQAARDAQIKLDGVTINSQSNKISSALTGVTLDLAAGSQGETTTLTVARNTEDKLKSSLEAFVKAYNDAVGSMNSLGAYDAASKTAGALQGNNVLRNAQNTLNDLVFNTKNGELSLSSIGVSIKGTDGTLALDAEKLAAAVAKDPKAIADFAAKIGTEFDKKINGIVGVAGSIQTSKNSLNTNIRDLEKRQEALESRLEKVEARYRAQFTALDVLLAKMNTTSSYLTQNLASLNASSS